MKFKCENCGSDKLGYMKYVCCLTPVQMNNNVIYVYSEPEYIEDSDSEVHEGFCCRDCGRLLSLYGDPIKCESDLRKYFHLFFPEKKEFMK